MTGLKRYHCPRCTLRHYPRCDFPRWPLRPLLHGITNPSETFNASSTTLLEYGAEGIPDHIADRWAVRLGKHPDMIWPGWTRAGLTANDEAFIDTGWRQAWEWTNPI